ncbi:MAG: hypothetical protein BRD55_02620 [Bacteroidetes bacterium SW_9_63_38]|nr:MAG: hypothetical protein BRD55_02620 [Bacteroidetes bacterium SW_9_63_38]
MPWYNPHDDWQETDAPTGPGLDVQINAPNRDERPVVRFQTDSDPFLLTGTEPRPETDTIHTVARIDPGTGTGTLLFVVHADGQNLVFEERAPDAVNDAVYDHVRSALNEIMVPVYIDDVIDELSEKVSGLAVLHTAQYDGTGPTWTYFRTSVFDDGTLLLEDEYGEMDLS